VQIALGGAECGQGLNQKSIQVAAMELGIPVTSVYITDTSTDKCPYSSPTGGSIGSGMVCASIINACNQINAILKPIRTTNPTFTFQQVVASALQSATHLQVIGNYVCPPPQKGGFNYNTYGATVSVVQLDCLTGQIEIEQVFTVYDAGLSINPAVDLGQVQGGFIFGAGLFLTENLEYSPDGELTTDGTWTYKPFTSRDIPIQWNVSLLKNSTNPYGVLGAKASGEPPMTMACSLFLAVKAAVEACRSQTIPKSAWVALASPCTVFEAQVACAITPSMLTF